MASKSMDWEEARAEFFQETYPSESLASNTSTEVRGRREGQHRHNFRDASVGTLESRSSRISIHLNRTTSTTPADAVSPPGTDDSPPSVAAGSSTTAIAGLHSSTASMNNRSTTAKARMRAAVQGLEEEESDEGEIEVVDFTDGKSNTYICSRTTTTKILAL